MGRHGALLRGGVEVTPALLYPTGPVGSGGETAAPAAVRVLVADGEALVRAGFRVLLGTDPRISVVGEAATGEEALALARGVRPDVVLIDASLPGIDSVEASRILSESGVAVMLLTNSTGDERILAALRAGAGGLLHKDAEPTELIKAVKALARGEAPISPCLARRLIAELTSRPEPSCPSPELVDVLTAREREVVMLVALGLDNDEIAKRLGVKHSTAKTHVSRAMVKLDAHHRAQVVVFAYEAGLVAPRSEAPERPPLSLAS